LELLKVVMTATRSVEQRDNWWAVWTAVQRVWSQAVVTDVWKDIPRAVQKGNWTAGETEHHWVERTAWQRVGWTVDVLADMKEHCSAVWRVRS
jgi:hypothetical protein